jgi:uroporphyrin-3 C-methyltransferase
MKQEGTMENNHRNKPVVVYIMVLFIFAFLLMAFSFFTHQRSNEAVIGSLQSNVSILQDLQASQDANLKLQSQLDEAHKEQTRLEGQMKSLQAQVQDEQTETDALLALYTLEQLYAAGNMDACKQAIQSMEDALQPTLLSKESIGDVVSPQERYQQLKEAVMSS